MSPVKVGEIYLIPEWFGLEPSEAQDVITQLLQRAGGRPSRDSFTLNVRALGNLRREGVTIRNRRTVRTSYEAAMGNREHVAAVRSWVALTRARVSGYQANIARRRHPFGLAPVVHPRPTTAESAMPPQA